MNEPSTTQLSPRERQSSMDRPASRSRRRHRKLMIAGVAGVAAVALLALWLGRLQPAVPTVDKSTLWLDEVKRGDMLLEVQGQGSLVPEQIRWISAVSAARVDKILVKPGAAVEQDTALCELINPDVQLQALEAERQVATAVSGLVNLQANQRREKLGQESTVASLRSELSEARLRAEADLDLANRGFLGSLEMSQSKAKAEELEGRIEFEEKRLAALSEGMAAQVSATQAQLERLRSIAQFRRREVLDLTIRAGVNGVLQDLPLQVGQWVTPGTLLAKVVQPDKLKAEIRIAETRMIDVRLGQRARIDTRNGVVAGEVTRIDPAVHNGAVKIDVHLDGPLPAGARPDLSVEGTIEIEHLVNVLYVGRPAFVQSDGVVGLFKLVEGGRYAERVRVQLGKASVKTVEVVEGLREKDAVILSDLSTWDGASRIRLR